MRETWYVLEDGAAVHPNEVSLNEKGVLIHKGGLAVAMRGDVPRSRGVDPEEERAKAKPKPGTKSREMRPEETKSGYSTREAKAEPAIHKQEGSQS